MSHFLSPLGVRVSEMNENVCRWQDDGARHSWREAPWSWSLSMKDQEGIVCITMETASPLEEAYFAESPRFPE